MGNVTLPHRNSLSRNIHVFGSVNGRGAGRIFRFGDVAADRAKVESAIAGLRQQNHMATRMDIHANTNWAALFSVDPAWTRDAYSFINEGVLDPSWEPTVEIWIQNRGNASVTPPVVPPPAATPSTPVTLPIVPGMTDAGYQAAIAAAQAEAARLASLAAARYAALVAEGKQKEAEAVAAQAAKDAANVASPKKSSLMPLLLAAGALLLITKG